MPSSGPAQMAMLTFRHAAKARQEDSDLAKLAQRKGCDIFARLASEKQREADALSRLGVHWLIQAMERDGDSDA